MEEEDDGSNGDNITKNREKDKSCRHEMVKQEFVKLAINFLSDQETFYYFIEINSQLCHVEYL